MGAVKRTFEYAQEWHTPIFDGPDDSTCQICGAHVPPYSDDLKHKYDAYGDRFEYQHPNGLDRAIYLTKNTRS